MAAIGVDHESEEYKQRQQAMGEFYKSSLLVDKITAILMDEHVASCGLDLRTAVVKAQKIESMFRKRVDQIRSDIFTGY